MTSRKDPEEHIAVSLQVIEIIYVKLFNQLRLNCVYILFWLNIIFNHKIWFLRTIIFLFLTLLSSFHS